MAHFYPFLIKPSFSKLLTLTLKTERPRMPSNNMDIQSVVGTYHTLQILVILLRSSEISRPVISTKILGNGTHRRQYQCRICLPVPDHLTKVYLHGRLEKLPICQECVSSFFHYIGERDKSLFLLTKVSYPPLYFLVMGADLFNGDLSLWDTSSVTDMSTMFQSALTYKGIGLSNWYTSSVTNLQATFEEAVSFVGNITTWDTSKVIDLQRTFQYASSFNGDISRWNVSLVKCFSYAFSGASSFNRDLSSWDVSSAHSMIGMVREQTFAGIFHIRSTLN